MNMTDLLRRGDRVRHETRTDWGLGEVLDDQAAGSLKVKVIFEDVGVKTFDLGVARMRRVFGKEAQSDYLSSLVKQAAKSGGESQERSVIPCAFVPARHRNLLARVPEGRPGSAVLEGGKGVQSCRTLPHVGTPGAR